MKEEWLKADSRVSADLQEAYHTDKDIWNCRTDSEKMKTETLKWRTMTMTKVRINEKEPYGEPRIIGNIVEAEKIDGKNPYRVAGSELIKHCEGKGCHGFVSNFAYN